MMPDLDGSLKSSSLLSPGSAPAPGTGMASLHKRVRHLLYAAILFCSLSQSATAAGFLTAATYPTGLLPAFPAVADFNHDGHADLVVANAADVTIGVLLNNG